jgi:hypothetical protein
MRSEADQITTRYLLGELSEAEQMALEREYFSSGEAFDRVLAAENNLVDSYVRDRLAPDARQRFEQIYLAHPKRRERVRFAEALAAKVDQSEVRAAQASVAESTWGRLLASMRRPKLAWASSFALVLLAAVGVWYLMETRRLRREFAQAESQRVAQVERERVLQQQIANDHQRAEELAAETARQQNGSPGPTPLLKTSPTFASLILTVGGTRAAEAAPPAVLVIPAGVEQVRIQLTVRESAYQNYRAVLQTASGQQVFAWQRLIRGTKKASANFVLNLPASKFIAGDYILTLKGVSENGEGEDISKSLFRVERK